MHFSSSHLIRSRHGVYYFRAAIPLHLRAAVGQQEIRRSLQTRDRNAALKAAQHLSHRVADWMTALEKGSVMDENTLKMMKLGLLPKLTEFHSPWGLMKTDGHSAADEEAIVSRMMAALVTQLGGPDKALQAIASAQAAIAKPDAMTVPATSNQAPQAPPTAVPSEVTLGQIIKEFLDWGQNDKKWTAASLKEVREFTSLWMRALCEDSKGIVHDRPIASISRKDLRSARDLVCNLPCGINQGKYRGKSLRECVKLRGKYEDKPQAAHTLKKKITWLATLFKFASDESSNRYTLQAHANGLQKRIKSGDKKSRRGFSPEELDAIFVDHSVFNARQFSAPWEYFVPLIGLYTGARLNEICQLHVTDIYESRPDGIWVIDINDNTDEYATIEINGVSQEQKMKSIKSEASHRLIPIHPKLIEAGLVDYRNVMAQRGEKRVFPEFTWNPDAHWGRLASVWFNRELCDDAGVDAEDVDFHSFRHTVANRLANLPDVEARFITAIIGHERGFTFDVYSGEFRPSVLMPIISRIDYGFSHQRYDAPIA